MFCRYRGELQDVQDVDEFEHVKHEVSQESQLLVRLLPKYPLGHTMVQLTPFQYPILQDKQVVLSTQVLQGLIQLSQTLPVVRGKYPSGHMVLQA